MNIILLFLLLLDILVFILDDCYACSKLKGCAQKAFYIYIYDKLVVDYLMHIKIIFLILPLNNIMDKLICFDFLTNYTIFRSSFKRSRDDSGRIESSSRFCAKPFLPKQKNP